MFGSVAASAAPADFILDIPLSPGWPQREQLPCEKLWRIRSAGKCIQRFTEGTSPLTENQFNASQLPAAASQGGSGYFKLAINVSTSAFNSSFIIDVGQTLDIYAYSVNTSLVGPTGMEEVTPGNIGTLTASGLTLDARIGAALLQVEESVSNKEAKFTQHIIVLNSTQSVIAVPNGAVSVRIIQSPAGPNSGDWTRFIGAPGILTTPFPTGRIAFFQGGSIAEHWEVGDETHLQTDQNNNVDRFFTLVWTIRP